MVVSGDDTSHFLFSKSVRRSVSSVSYTHLDVYKRQSIYKTGLHRSQKEADKKNLFTMQLTGGHGSYQHNRIQLGITGIYYLFNRPYEPELTGYSK